MSEETFWLASANISLGVVTVFSVVLFVKVVFENMPHRIRGGSPGAGEVNGKGQSGREHSSG